MINNRRSLLLLDSVGDVSALLIKLAVNTRVLVQMVRQALTTINNDNTRSKRRPDIRSVRFVVVVVIMMMMMMMCDDVLWCVSLFLFGFVWFLVPFVIFMFVGFVFVLVWVFW